MEYIFSFYLTFFNTYLFIRCFEHGQYRQALGIAIETKRMDIFERAVTGKLSDEQVIRFIQKTLSGTELNELERSLNYLPPVQILNHRLKSALIFNIELVIQDLNVAFSKKWNLEAITNLSSIHSTCNIQCINC